MSFRNLIACGSNPGNLPRPNRNRGISGLKELEDIMYNSLPDSVNCIFLHPNESRSYTSEELRALGDRDFQTRLLITGTQCAGDTVFLRTHHTDNAGHRSHFNYVRDYLKAAHITKNTTCAKSNLTTLLTMCFELSSSDYYTFATSLASGLSNYGGNTDFEISKLMAPSTEDVPNLRMKLCLLMDVIFNKMAIKKFLLDERRNNIFRLIYCETKHTQKINSFYAAVFSFTLQLCLTLYIGLRVNKGTDLYDSDIPAQFWDKYNPAMFALAIFTFAYSIMVALSTISETLLACKILFKEVGTLILMDLIVNVILPLLLAYYGFLLILSEVSFIDAVLNTTALLFIPEIDDQLPQILGYSDDDIVKNFLINESMKDFDKVTAIDIKLEEKERTDIVCGLEFGDFYITNMIEQGTIPQKGYGLQPYQVTQVDNKGVQIDPSTTVTTDCLLRKIEWRYTTGFPKSTTPRIGGLTLTKIDGQEIKIVRIRDITGKVGISHVTQSLEGLFIMTTFQMSEDVFRLRVCGSHNVKNFLKAFDYYSLWDVTTEARREIHKLY